MLPNKPQFNKILSHLEKLFQQTSLENADYYSGNFDWQKSFSLLGWAYFDWSQAENVFKNLFAKTLPKKDLQDSPTIQPPVFGFLLWQMYQIAKDKEQALLFLEEMYPQILELHLYYYENNDPDEEGLWTVSKIQDPLFSTLLIWSNEALINIGGTLNEDVAEIMDWHEKGIHTMNTKLWNENICGYQAFDVTQNEQIETQKLVRFIPFAAGIPEIDAAFTMFHAIMFEKKLADDSPILKWMLYRGILLYEDDFFLEFAKQLEQEALQLFETSEQKKLEMFIWILTSETA